MSIFEFVLAVLAVWRLTHLLVAEDGPFQAIAWLRRTAGHGFWGSLLDCFYCLSLWIAVPFALWLRDRKSTRLNSSHSQISYAVFCLTKKKLPAASVAPPAIICAITAPLSVMPSTPTSQVAPSIGAICCMSATVAPAVPESAPPPDTT